MKPTITLVMAGFCVFSLRVFRRTRVHPIARRSPHLVGLLSLTICVRVGFVTRSKLLDSASQLIARLVCSPEWQWLFSQSSPTPHANTPSTHSRSGDALGAVRDERPCTARENQRNRHRPAAISADPLGSSASAGAEHRRDD